MRRYGYQKRRGDGWWVLALPGFYDLNAYVWRGKDKSGKDNTNGYSLTRRRLRMLRSHWRGFRR